MVIIVALIVWPLGVGNYIVVALMVLGIVTDIFDGILARKYEVSTEGLRVQDTVIDLAMYMSILAFLFIQNPALYSENELPILVILGLEAAMYLVSLLRFVKLPSPHAIPSKFWGIYLVVEFTLLLLGVTGTHFRISLFIGCAVHIDRLLIYILLPSWNHDIPSCYHAWELRQGKEIKRMKLFNG